MDPTIATLNILLIGGMLFTTYDFFKKPSVWAAISTAASFGMLFIINQ